MHILIAEDDFTSRTVLTGVLKKHGHEILVTENGAEAWQVMQQPNAPGLAVLDWMMPEMDGPEVVRRIRAQLTDRPPYIIMLTTKGEKADISTGLDDGANDYIVKPFDASELCARINVGQRMVEMQNALAVKIAELQQALDQIKTLHGILPICTNCKKIRDDQGYWNPMEAYVRDHTEAEFSHAICPDCTKKLYPEFLREKTEGKS